MIMNDIQNIKKLLSEPKKIAIISHRNPDGDAVGSSLAMYHYLIQLNHTVTVIMPNDLPDFLTWMPAASSLLIYENSTKKIGSKIAENDLIFTLDFNALHRTGDKMETFLKTLSIPMIMIDHHQQPENYPLYTFSDVSYGSTAEMVYDFICNLDDKQLINKEIATCLYTGIVTDSGSFRYPLTTPKTHRIVAELVEKGINHSEIHNQLFDNGSLNRLKILGKALQNLVVLPEYKTSYITLTQTELDEFNQQKGDTEGIVNYGLMLKNIDFSVIFIENKYENYIKISFRSQGSFDVNQFARNYFDGGGHINAAGGKSFVSMDETIERFISILKQEKNNP